MFHELKNKLEKKMEDSFQSFLKDIQGLRTGRVTTQLLDPVQVDAYGSKMPLNQVATVSVQGPLTLQIQVWSQEMVPQVEKAISDAGLGLNPQTAGSTLRIQVPDLSEERRKELAKTLGKYAENGRVAVRSIRRMGMDALEKAEKDNDISEDELRAHSGQIQKMTDGMISKIDQTVNVKKTELMSL